MPRPMPSPEQTGRLAAAIALLGVDPQDARRVRVRWRSETGDALVRLLLPSPAGDVRRWRHCNAFQSKGSAVRALDIFEASIRKAAETGAWEDWHVGDPPFIPFLHHPETTP